MSRWPLAVLGSLVAAACGGQAQEPLLGDWLVQSHTRNAAGCDVEGPQVAAPPLVRFEVSDVLGQPVLELVDCATEGTCAPSAGVSGRLFTENIPFGRRADAFAAFRDATGCQLGARRADATITSDGLLHLETRRHEERDVSGVVCEVATAERLLASLTCLERDVIVAARPDTP